jgi:anti-sigma factor RsiW
MDCEKYGDRVTDAALETLSPSEHAEFVEHMGTCKRCAEAFRRASELATFVDRGMDSLVEGAPSAGFELRLRARLAEEAIPMRRVWAGRMMAAATALALAGAVLLGAVHTFRGKNSSPAIASRAFPAVPIAAENAPAHDHGMAMPRARPARAVSAGPVRANEPAVLIDPSQLAAIEEFASAIAAGRVEGAELVSAHQEIEKPLKIPVLEIPPIEDATQDATRSADDSGGF